MDLRREGVTLGYTMTEFIDNMLDNYFENRSLYDISPFSVENLRDCILFEIIKTAYDESGEKKSLRANRGSDDDDKRMRDSRWMSYAQHYRTLQYYHIMDSANISIPELLPDNVKSMSGKIEGHKLTKMQYFEINTMANIPIFKSIVSKRICCVKKISNDDFIRGMEEYDKLVVHLINLLDGDVEDVLFGSIALFTLEWKYNIELFYNCAVEAEKRKISEVPVHRIAALCAELSIPLPPYFTTKIHTESRFVLHRLDLVSYLYSEKDKMWDEVEAKFYDYFVVKHYIESEIVHKWSMSEYFITHIPRERWVEFIREHYDLRKIYKPKEWNNKRVRYFRKIVGEMVKNMPVPKL